MNFIKHSFFGYFIFLSLLLLPQKSFSGLYFEPYLGVGILARKPELAIIKSGYLNEIKGTDNSNETKGQSSNWLAIGTFYMRTALGTRVGWSKLGLAFGLDLSGSYYNNIVIFGINEQFWTVLPGAFLSYQFPVFFRVYGTLIPYGFLINAMKEQDCSLEDISTIHKKCSRLLQNIKSEKPVIRSLKLGVGYTGLPFLNINLEYQPFYFIATGNTEREGFWTHGITAYISYIF